MSQCTMDIRRYPLPNRGDLGGRQCLTSLLGCRCLRQDPLREVRPVRHTRLPPCSGGKPLYEPRVPGVTLERHDLMISTRGPVVGTSPGDPMAHVAPWAIRGVTRVVDKSRTYRQEDATGTSPTAVMRTLWALHIAGGEGAAKYQRASHPDPHTGGQGGFIYIVCVVGPDQPSGLLA